MVTRAQTRRSFSAGLAGCWAAAADSGSLEHPQRTVEVRRGAGPAVIFEAGLGDGLESWDAVFKLLPPTVTTFRSTRARGADNVADTVVTLSGALKRARMSGPFVLVGHSIGGVYVTRFAQRYASDVVALMLVDGRPLTFRAACAERDILRCRNGLPRPATDNINILNEWQAIAVEERRAAPPRLPDGIRATILAATREWSGAEGAAARDAWLEQQRRLAAAWNARYVPVASGHYIQTERPEVVADELARLLAALS